MTWRLVGPLLAEHFSVIAPDNRGSGDSSIPKDGLYDAASRASDIEGLLSYLGINQTLVLAHDKGCSAVIALAASNPSVLSSVAVSEYMLPGFGYEEASYPQHSWDLSSNWHLSLFAVTDSAEFLMRGREREFLSWYFWHASFAGSEAIPDDVLDRYVTSIRKPGFLRALIGPFSALSIRNDADLFQAALRAEQGGSKLKTPLLAIGGEASMAPADVVRQLWSPVSENLEVDVAPKAGHWIPDENPTWLANRAQRFFADTAPTLQPVDLSWLDNSVTAVST